MRKFKVPEVTVGRLSLYLRCLNELEEEEVELISSAELGRRCGVNPAQIRKDLAYFGEFGTRGVGYSVKELREDIKVVMGLNKTWEVALVGVGNLGTALLQYRGFQRHGFKLSVAFDNSLEGKDVPEHCELHHSDEMEKIIKDRGIKLAIVAVHYSQAQKVAERLAKAGIKGILNFAPTKVKLPKGVVVRNVDLGTELEILTFYLSLRAR
jgi:redox-sensing transcriptional repressor